MNIPVKHEQIYLHKHPFEGFNMIEALRLLIIFCMLVVFVPMILSFIGFVIITWMIINHFRTPPGE